MLKPAMRIGYRFFGKYVHNYRQHIQPLADRLKIARIPYTVEEYVAGIVLFVIIAFTVPFIASFSMFSLAYGAPILTSLSLSFVISVSISGITWIVLMNYPNYVAKNRGEEIHARLAFTVTHMSTLAGTGISPVVVFKALTKFRDYGEISRECAFIVKDVEVFGKDLYTAIMDAARHSPSKLWSEILWGIVSTLRSGGNLHTYLSEKARQLVELHEREEKKAVETLNILTEIFMVVFVLAPIMGVMIVVFMSMFGGVMFGGDPKLLLMVFIYFILPIIGAGFLIMGELSKPKEVL